jgi:PAS domain S-box-containing protein
MNLNAPDQLAQFFELSLDLFCVADSEGYFKVVNSAWQRTLGYSKEEMLAHPYIYFVHPDDINLTKVEQQKLDAGGLSMNFENRYRAKDGTWKWLAWRSVPQPDGSIYAVARDITTQKEDEKATHNLLRKLEQSNRALDQFAYIVSHDLKSPLRSIINLSQWLKEDYESILPEEGKSQINLLQGRAERMQHLINDLLQFAKTGRDERPLELLDPKALIDEIRDSQPNYGSFSIVCATETAPIFARPHELYQLFQNLICNAYKYRAHEDGYVRIRQIDADRFWRFEFEDNGIGIEAKHHQRIFQVFQRLANSEDIEGTGIGLALVKKIVESAGGELHVDSALGQGSTFSFSWPKTQLTMPEPSN